MEKKIGRRFKNGLCVYDYDLGRKALFKIREKWAEQGIRSIDDLVSEEVFEIEDSYINRVFK